MIIALARINLSLPVELGSGGGSGGRRVGGLAALRGELLLLLARFLLYSARAAPDGRHSVVIVPGDGGDVVRMTAHIVRPEVVGPLGQRMAIGDVGVGEEHMQLPGRAVVNKYRKKGESS
jgi:hypothetical protein